MKQSGLGIASLVIGIVSLVFSCFGLGFLGIIGFIFSMVAITQKDKGKGTAVAGLITSIIAFLISFFVVVVGFGFSLFSNETAKKGENKKSNIKTSTIEEKIFYDNGGIKIICKEGEIGNDFHISFYAENNSDEDIDISLSGISINNISFPSEDINDSLYEEIMSGNKTNFEINVEPSIFSGKGIKNISKIVPMFVVQIDESENIQIQEEIYTDNEDLESVEIEGGIEIYSDENFQILYLKNIGNKFTFSIYNKTDKYIDYYIDTCSVNGYSFDLSESKTNVFDRSLFSDTYGFFEIIVEDEFLKKNSIDDVEKIEFKMYADSDAAYFSSDGDIKTEMITVEFK